MKNCGAFNSNIFKSQNFKVRLILKGVRLISPSQKDSLCVQISNSKTSFGPNFKIRPPLFFQNWFGPEEPRKRLGHGKSTNGQLAHSMAPRGGQSTSGPSQGQFTRGPSRGQSASSPS